MAAIKEMKGNKR